VAPWYLEIAVCPSLDAQARFGKTRALRALPLDSTLATISQTSSGPQYQLCRKAIHGILDSLGDVLHAQDSWELLRHLSTLDWDYSDVAAILATTARVKRATDDFVERKYARPSWQEGHQVRILYPKLCSSTADEKKMAEFKSTLTDVQSVTQDHKFVIRVGKGGSIGRYEVSGYYLYDTKYAIFHFNTRCI
jgi:hypothetical protein